MRSGDSLVGLFPYLLDDLGFDGGFSLFLSADGFFLLRLLLVLLGYDFLNGLAGLLGFFVRVYAFFFFSSFLVLLSVKNTIPTIIRTMSIM